MAFELPDYSRRWKVPLVEYSSGSAGRISDIVKFQYQEEAMKFYDNFNKSHPNGENTHIVAGEPYYE